MKKIEYNIIKDFNILFGFKFIERKIIKLNFETDNEVNRNYCDKAFLYFLIEMYNNLKIDFKLFNKEYGDLLLLKFILINNI